MTISDTFPNGLRIPQVVGALRIQQQRRILLADQPGSGKTAQALVAAELDGLFARPSATLILCNVTGCQLTWAGELRTRVATQYDVVIADLTDTGGNKTMPSVARRDDKLATSLIEARDLALPLIVLANYDLVRWPYNSDTGPKLATLWDIEFDMVVIDEAHLVLPTMVDAKRDLSQFLFGLYHLRYTADPIKLPMTGTPDRGKLWNRYGHWKWLYPASYQSFWSWARNQFVCTPGKWGGMEIGKMRHPDAWRAYDQQHMIRRTKAEMLEGLPEKQWAGDGGIDLPMTPLQAEAYTDYLGVLQQAQEAFVADGKESAAQAMGLTMALRERQMATCTWTFTTTYDVEGKAHVSGKPIVAGPNSSNKLAWLNDWLSARGYGTDFYDPSLGKVVIVSFFTEILHWLQTELAALGFASNVLAGDSSLPEKQAVEAEFQRGNLRIVLLSGHLGVSINLDAADDMIFVDGTHDPDRMEQAEDRIHRASRNHQCLYWRLVSMGTGDVVVTQAIDSRYYQTRQSYDGDRGVQFARKMLGYLPREEMSIH